jgi:Skp family chaperone for outer membrane proteins
MKRTIVVFALVVAGALFAASTLTAQDQPTRIVFVDGPRLIAAHPAGQAASDLERQAQEDLMGIEESISALVGGARTLDELTPEQRDQLDLLQRTLQEARQRWRQDILATVEPALEAVNQAVREVAQENGYTLVLDGAVAGQSGLSLVVYAQDGLDITERVIARIRQ